MRNILCIDLKSFFASCECVERGYDAFSYPLVVANPHQGDGAITLAVTPFLKSKGVKSRGRLFEIPKNIKYFIVEPRMSLYIKYSEKVIATYLEFISCEDLYIYSIDECFLDVTNYLKLYKKTDYELAEEILKKIYKNTGLTATCGISYNMLLAKVAMDTEAKKYKNGIAKWDKNDIKDKLWKISPLSNMWGIGKRYEKTLNDMGIFTIKDLALFDKNKLIKKFGIMGKELWNHANGIDSSLISDYKIDCKDKSYSHSQVLMKNYDLSNINIIIKEMVEVLTSRLRKNNKMCQNVGFGIGYSKEINSSFYHTIKLDNPTNDEEEIFNICIQILNSYSEDLPIRKVSISLNKLINYGTQLNLFKETKNLNYDKTIDKIKEKFGKNSIVKASALLEDSTIIERNKKIGGHHE